MPFCPCQYTDGVLLTSVFCPCCVTSQTGPTFSVTSMRPSGRKAIRHGRVKVVTVVMVNGMVASGFCSPALTCAHAADDTRASSKAPVADFTLVSPSLRFASRLLRFGLDLHHRLTRTVQ